MSAHYTIQGEWTRRIYLVLVEARGLTVFNPGNFTLPWTGDSGTPYGLSYHPGAGMEFGGPLWFAGWRARRYIARQEAMARRGYERKVQAERFAARRKGSDR